jgi:hypothetical protein
LHEAFGYMHTQLATAGRRLEGSGGGERGQGTVEYVALVLLVGLVMLGVVAAMKTYKFGGGQELGDLIVKKIREAVGKVTY